MWTYVPGLSESSPSAQGWADSTTALSSRCQMLSQFAWWRGTHSAPRVWLARCGKASWLLALSGLISAPSTASRGVESWIRSLQASRASPQALPASVKEQPMSDGSGVTCSESSARFNPAGSTLKTSPVCSLRLGLGWGNQTAATLFEAGRWERFSGDWPRWGSMRNGVVFRRAPSDLHRGECGGSVWPTPQVFDSNTCERSKEAMARAKEKGGCANLREHVVLWATPSAQEPGIDFERIVDRDGNRPTHLKQRLYDRETGRLVQDGLPQQVQFWATPRSSDGEKGGPNMRGSKGDMMLPSQSALWALPTTRERSGPSEEERNTPNIGLQAQRMTQAGKWFSRDNPNSPLRYQLQWRFVAWLMGLPCSLITPIE